MFLVGDEIKEMAVRHWFVRSVGRWGVRMLIRDMGKNVMSTEDSVQSLR